MPVDMKENESMKARTIIATSTFTIRQVHIQLLTMYLVLSCAVDTIMLQRNLIHFPLQNTKNDYVVRRASIWLAAFPF